MVASKMLEDFFQILCSSQNIWTLCNEIFLLDYGMPYTYENIKVNKTENLDDERWWEVKIEGEGRQP